MKEYIAEAKTFRIEDDEFIDLATQNVKCELIRCKDCKQWFTLRDSACEGLCMKLTIVTFATEETDYCSWAERREE